MTIFNSNLNYKLRLTTYNQAERNALVSRFIK